MQSATISSVASRDVASFVDLVFPFFSLYSSDQLSLSASDSSATFSTSCLVILLEKISRSASVVFYTTVRVISVSNGGRSTSFLDFQSRSFFDFASLPEAARKSTSVVRRRIFSPLPAKAHSISIKTTVGALRDPARAKAATFLPMDLFPMDACAYVA